MDVVDDRTDLVFVGRKLLSGSHPVGEFVVQPVASTHEVDGDGGQRDAADQATEDVHRQEVLLSHATAERLLQRLQSANG